MYDVLMTSRHPLFAGLLLLAARLYANPLEADEPAAPQPVAPENAWRPKAMPRQSPTAQSADQALRYSIERRSAEGDIPTERYEAARQRVSRMPIYSFSQGRRVPKAEADAFNPGDFGGWVPLGPGNQGGRTRVLLIHPATPEIMYAGSVTGSIWKTTDAGQNWKPMADLLPALGIGSMAFHPNDPETLFVGTGFWFNTLSSSNLFGAAPRGAGIYKSTDGGVSWIKLGNPDPAAFRYVNRIQISRTNPDRIYAATWAGVYASADGGESWKLSLRPAGNTTGCQSMVMRSDVQTDYLFAACGVNTAESPALYRNTDAGGEGVWERVHQPAGMANTTLALAPSNQSVIYALSAGNEPDNAAFRNGLLAVFRSTSNGDAGSWTPQVTNKDPEPLNRGLLSSNSTAYRNICSNGAADFTSQGWIHNVIAVDPRDPDKVFVGGIDIYRSDDGGSNWGIASFWQAADGPQGAHGDNLNFIFHPGYDGEGNQQMFVVGDGGIYRSKNARAAVAHGDRGGCSPFTNQVAWEPLHGGYATLQFYTGAVYPGGAAWFGGAQDNGTYRGSDASPALWTKLRGGDGASVLINPGNPNTLYTSIQNFGFARSVDGGRTFATATKGVDDTGLAFITPVVMDPADPQRLWTGGNTFWTTTNGGLQWTQASTQLTAAQGAVSAMAVAPSDPDRVLMATSQGFIFRNAGARAATADTAWEVARPRSGYVSSLSISPQNPDVIYATYSQFNTATAAGHIWRSTNGGANWEVYEGAGATAIPDIPVLQLMIDPTDAQRLYLATDIGVFVSTDAGASWARDAGPFANVVTEQLILNRDTGVTRLYAFTFGRGAWRAELPNSGTACTYEISGLQPVPAIGGDFTVDVQTGDGCRWAALPFGSMITIQTPGAGSGAGTLRLNMPLNTSTQARQFGIDVQNRTVRASQQGALGVSRNDEVTTAASIATLPYVGVVDSRGLTTGASDPAQSCAPAKGSKTAWWSFTAKDAGELEFTLQGQRYDVFGNSGLTASVYPLTGNTPGAELGCTTIARNTGTWVFSRFTAAVQAGQRYAVMISATGSTATDGGYTVLGIGPK